MKSIDANEIDQLPGKNLKKNDLFHFRCHSEITCFNKCCRNLNLFLYPYDIVRLKNALGLSSEEFIDTHTDIVLRPDNFFPDVLLKMAENEEKTCPFLSEKGCSVYLDRPDTCRTFPVEQGLLFDKKGNSETVHFFRPPDFCQGQNEPTEWTLDSWEIDQNAQNHHTMTKDWAKLKSLFVKNPWGAEGARGPRAKIAFMAVYNTETFRSFIFTSSFLKRYKVKPDIQKKIKRNDTELLKFGFAFLRVTLFGLPSKRLKPKG